MTVPTPTRHGWQVWTTDALNKGFNGYSPTWHWTAWGPRGFEAGVEREPEAAKTRAQAAAYVLSGEEMA